MVLYFVLLIAGSLSLYHVMFLWGLSAGLVSPGPYYALLGGLLVFPFAATASLYFPRTATWVALLGGALQMVWPVSALVLGLGRPLELPIYGALPAVITAFSLYRVIRVKSTPGLQSR